MLDKNPRFDISNGLTITINKAKPEFRDPKKAKAGNSVDGGFAKYVICRENEGFGARNKRNLRTVSITLGGKPWFWQYSPYGYFNEHGIAVNCEHIPMHIDRQTLVNLLDFVDKFPHYFIGCNAPLERIGGSVLAHDHYQGGGVGWYGPGANTHRTPYGGRNFEYYSEDGFISGKLGEAECKGAMEKGTIPYFKHFFLNDQETNRIGVCTFSNEQAIREVYLRAFQYAFETAGENDKACTGVMGAFNRLGMTWTGHHKNLWKNVMEGEWGFTGNVTTDFGQKQGSLMEPQLAYEAGTHMFCTSGSGFANYLDGLDITKDLKLLTNMRESLHRQLYNFANSAAMNGLTSNSKIVTVRTWYENALLATTVISAVLLAGSGAMAVIQSFFNKKEEE